MNGPVTWYKKFGSKTTWMDLLHGIRSFAVDHFILSGCTRLTDRQTDGQTDRQTDFDSKTERMHSQSHGEKRPLSAQSTNGWSEVISASACQMHDVALLCPVTVGVDINQSTAGRHTGWWTAEPNARRARNYTAPPDTSGVTPFDGD